MTEHLTISNWQEFDEFHQQLLGERAPKPTEATVLVERRDGKIVACAAVTYVPVITSVAVAPEYRTELDLLPKMMGRVKEMFKSKVLLTFTKDSRIARLHRLFGFKDEGFASSWRP